jgi:hypothetical protein
MFHFKTLREALIQERRRGEILQSSQQQSKADIDYIAMMCDVELEVPEDEGMMHDEVEEA